MEGICLAPKSEEAKVVVCKEKADQESRICRKWSARENYLYASFLAINASEFEDEKGRRSQNFFTRMAEWLHIGKDNLQCRSHHQKMMARYKSVSNIMKELQKDQPPRKKGECVV